MLSRPIAWKTWVLALGLGACGRTESSYQAAEPTQAARAIAATRYPLVQATTTSGATRTELGEVNQPADSGGSPRSVSSSEDERRFRELLEALRHDGLKWNASRAAHELGEAWPDSSPWLEEGLDSADSQQRLLCAYVLMEKDSPPFPRLLEVAVESLRDDHLPRGRHGDGTRSYLFIFNADLAQSYLANQGNSARSELVKGLDNYDSQQELRCALLLAHLPDEGLHGELAELLIPHLLNNNIAGDAKMASRALLRIGKPALPGLRSLFSRTWDPQASRLSGALLDLIEGRLDPFDSYEKHDLKGVISRRTLTLDR